MQYGRKNKLFLNLSDVEIAIRELEIGKINAFRTKIIHYAVFFYASLSSYAYAATSSASDLSSSSV